MFGGAAVFLVPFWKVCASFGQRGIWGFRDLGVWQMDVVVGSWGSRIGGGYLQSRDPFSEFRPLVSEDGLLALNVEKVT